MFYTRLSDKTAHIAVFVVCLFFLSLARHILPAVLHVCPLSMLSVYQIRFSSDFPDKMKNKEFACIALSHLSGRRNNRRLRERKKRTSILKDCFAETTARYSGFIRRKIQIKRRRKTIKRVYPRRGDVRTVYLNAAVKESLFHEDWR